MVSRNTVVGCLLFAIAVLGCEGGDDLPSAELDPTGLTVKTLPGNVSTTVPTPYRGSGVGVLISGRGTSTTSILSGPIARKEAIAAATAAIQNDPLVQAIKAKCAAEGGNLDVTEIAGGLVMPTITGAVTITVTAVVYCQ
jgi:hypothetical protein